MSTILFKDKCFLCCFFFLVCFCSFLHFDRESISFISFWFSRVFAVLFFSFVSISVSLLFVRSTARTCSQNMQFSFALRLDRAAVERILCLPALFLLLWICRRCGKRISQFRLLGKKKKTKRKKQSWLFFCYCLRIPRKYSERMNSKFISILTGYLKCNHFIVHWMILLNEIEHVIGSEHHLKRNWIQSQNN